MPTDTDIVLSSRIRLARNIEGLPFPEWSTPSELTQVKRLSKKAIALADKNLTYKELNKTKELEKYLLVEQNTLSVDFIKGDPGAKAFAHKDETVTIMINEEDHLRLTIQKNDFDLDGCWKEIDKIDTSLSEQIQFSFNNNLGFMTSCPSNVGTGMRASVMLHLPALCIEGKISSIVASLNDSHITVRGLFGEGSMALGHIFQFSNLNTLGVSELETINYLKKITRSLIKKELICRKNILKRDKTEIIDKVRRAIGILKYAYYISYEEALDHLSLIILGQYLNVEKTLKPLKNFGQLSKQLRSAHLQKESKIGNSAKALETFRAEKIREIIE